MEKVYGLIGRTLGHSYSPLLHRALGNEAYRLIELAPEAVGSFVRRADIGGLNVTIPYKRAVLDWCDEVDPAAAAVGAVNTLVRRDGRLIGYNTDVTGFIYMLRRAGIDPAGRKVAVLGSGGASCAVRTGCQALGAGEIVTISRSGADNYDNLARHEDAEIVVNTTPVGMYPNCPAAPVSLAQFPRCRAVADVIYNPRRTALLQQAEALELPTAGGLSMLAAQAKASSELFFETPLPDGRTEELIALLRRVTENMVLIGMPGCGKSTVGQALAALSGRICVDIDAEIERAAGKSIPRLFAEDGEQTFRRMEREMIARRGGESGIVLVTGGGAVLDERNYAPLHQNGRIYQITRPLAQLATEGRPLSGDADALARLSTVRAPRYERFRDAVIDNDAAVEDVARRIWEDFCENSCDQRT